VRYWVAATDAEAALILDDDAAARAALTRAASLVGDDLSSAATTRRQLALLCDRLGRDPGLLDLLPAPRVVHYCGHLISAPGTAGRFPAEVEADVAIAVAAAVRGARLGFGSLACGADILFAEALLAEGAELHVYLPCDVADFVTTSVRCGGEAWPARFDACLGRATTVSVTSPGPYDGDELFDYCARVAMGNAITRADFLAAPVDQVAVWDGRPPSGVAGTARDVDTWAATGRTTTVIPVPGSTEPRPTPPPSPSDRTVRALLFADVGGFSRLDDRQIASFLETVMRPIAAAIDPFSASVRFRNTWGDGIYLVLDDAAAAAACGLAMQAAVAGIDFAAAGLPDDLTLRVAAHAGPVLERPDPVLGTVGVYGTVVTRAARMEPGTPAGAVYVTDQFAALLALEPDASVRGQYVGRLPTAKSYGTFPMYVLTPIPRPVPVAVPAVAPPA
jgi:class 3 adenylate cyclase